MRYVPDHAGIAGLLKGPEMQAVVRQVAERGLAFAVEHAPVGGPRDAHPGQYKAAFRVDVVTNGGLKGDRAEARIVNDAEDVVLVEVVDGYHVLADTAEYLGSGGAL